jgi:hypothetical protein
MGEISMGQGSSGNGFAKRHPVLIRFALIGVGGLFGVFAMVAILIYPEQVRPVADAPDPLEDFSKRYGVDLSPLLLRGAEMVVAESDATGNQEGHGAQEGEIADLRPIADVSALPKPLQRGAEDLNQAVDEMVLSMATLLEDPKSKSSYEKSVDLLNIHIDCQQACASFERQVHDYTAEFGSRETSDLYASLNESWRELEAFQNNVLLSILIANEQWESAARHCWQQGGYDLTHDPEWWDREVFYLRKNGLSGRAMLAYRTVMPVFDRWKRRLSRSQSDETR